ncbi:DNA-binding transcriptional regulator, CsgD family [Actinacidiphila alni]|uniref:DNA-binding transcriptional regulator, CsgD family n=1 Tax=Actinacidiphila alni TaxID=380248 RepID=A0A1I2L7E5_9ACTN|nr:LuxR C-terminal-related transcriptional regulator [Actinacidiphila alni]SFF75254.1 DNA-binding transcriptional regulator, CsgD family [Actinacidiphila alni]
MTAHAAGTPALRPLDVTVMTRLADGLRCASIAAELGVTTTVRAAIRRVRPRVGADGHVAQVLDLAYRSGNLPLPPRPAAPPPNLTEQQQRLLLQLADGQSYQQISTTDGIGLSTAKLHIRNLRQLLGADSRAHAVHLGWANRHITAGTALPTRPQPPAQPDPADGQPTTTCPPGAPR